VKSTSFEITEENLDVADNNLCPGGCDEARKQPMILLAKNELRSLGLQLIAQTNTSHGDAYREEEVNEEPTLVDNVPVILPDKTPTSSAYSDAIEVPGTTPDTGESGDSVEGAAVSGGTYFESSLPQEPPLENPRVTARLGSSRDTYDSTAHFWTDDIEKLDNHIRPYIADETGGSVSVGVTLYQLAKSMTR
jgi:hypothetical protein